MVMQLQMILQIILLLFSINAIFVQAADLASNGSPCQRNCGNVSDIPFPFGIGAGCYLDPWFEVVCNNNDSWVSPKRAVLKKLDLEVLNISLGGYNETKDYESRSLIVNYPTFSICNNGSKSTKNPTLANSPFFFSQSRNIFVAMGCHSFATMTSSDGSVIGCTSVCDTSKEIINNTRCNGINCCQATIDSSDSDLDAFNTTIEAINTKEPIIDGCKSAFLVQAEWFKTAYPLISNQPNTSTYAHVFLNWGIPKTSVNSLPIANYNTEYSEYYCYNVSISVSNSPVACYCRFGFIGNPYLPEGCKDIDECLDPSLNTCLNESKSAYCVNTHGSFVCKESNLARVMLIVGLGSSTGLLVLLIIGWWFYKVVKKKRAINKKNKFFKRMLRQQLSSHQANVENTTLFTLKVLENATNHFNVNRILGQGGQVTVYKGMLVDGRIVAVKKSKIIDERKFEEFINEVVILSQINHRNVVKLIGCCLEMEIPLLVYEYVPNGTLFQYINGQIEEFPLTWDMRLRIATEVAGALFYLHSAASTPIYHRDIKSTNILLDDKYRAKVADFGTSRSIAVDQTHLTTLVHGTFGYLDPEYFQSSQFTEKSDVYSFGIVLAELLTGKKAISSTRTRETRNLATHFIQSVEENNLFDIIDSRVLKEGKEEEIIAVGNLVKRCLNLIGKKRPTMKEVTKELEGIQMLQKAPNLRQKYCKEVEYVQEEMHKPWDYISSSTMPTSSANAQPLLSSQSV